MENGYKDEETENNKYVDILFYLFRYAIRVHKMSYKNCMDMDIIDYIDFLEFDMVRSPMENNTSDFSM